MLFLKVDNYSIFIIQLYNFKIFLFAMRKFLVKVNNQQFEVELEEVKGQASKPVTAASSNGAGAASTSIKSSSNGSGTAVLAGGEKIAAPMPGNILKVNVKAGDQVKRGQVLLVLEAMKMENEITAPADSKVSEILVQVGQAIKAGDTMVVLA
jgi:biotin carboxyl carrier protein